MSASISEALSSPRAVIDGLLPSTGLFIGGEWRAGDGSATFEVIDPSTEEPIAEVASASVSDGLSAVEAAAAAASEWSSTAPRQRAEILRRAFELMIEREDMFAELVVLENGKTMQDARGEIRYAAEFFRWYAEEAVRIGGSVSTAPAGDKKILVLNQPIGVCLLVTPWNFPAAMATRKVAPALAAGCTTVLKPASDTPLTALALGALLAEAGVPAGAVNVIPSAHTGPLVEACLGHPAVRKLSFTGSTEVGRILLHGTADRVLSSSMELGGNAPFLVFADADLDSAVEAAMVAKMRNGGEACTAANRFYVERPVMKQFTDALAKAMGALRVGPGREPGVELGPLVSASQRSGVAALVDEAAGDGARVVVGGAPLDRRGYFYAPTVLAEVRPGARILEEEIFGPVAPVVPFDGEDEALALANDSEFGLISYVMTGDLSRGLRVAERLESGMVGVNRGLVSDPAAPFGGTKQSGLGREGAHEGILEFLEPKYVAVNW